MKRLPIAIRPLKKLGRYGIINLGWFDTVVRPCLAFAPAFLDDAASGRREGTVTCLPNRLLCLNVSKASMGWTNEHA